MFTRSDLEAPDHRLWPKLDTNRPGLIQISESPSSIRDSNSSVSVSSSSSLVGSLASKASDLGRRVEKSGMSLLSKASEFTPSLVLRRHDSHEKSPRHQSTQSLSPSLSPSLSSSATSPNQSPLRASVSLSGSSASLETIESGFLSSKLVFTQGLFKTILDTLPFSRDAFNACHKRLFMEGLRYVTTRISLANVDDDSKRTVYDWLLYVPKVVLRLYLPCPSPPLSSLISSYISFVIATIFRLKA